jgi:hypothetical protein
MPATAVNPLADRLKAIEHEIKDRRDQLPGADAEVKAAQAAYAGTENLKPGSPEFETAKAAVAKAGTIKDEIAAYQAEQTEVLQMMAANGNQAPPRERTPDESMRGNGWDASRLFADAGLVATLETASHSKGRFGGVELGEVMGRDAFATDVAPTTNMRRGDWFGVVPQIQRPLRVLDLLKVGTMNENTFPYTQETGSLDAGVAETAESATKPSAGQTLTDQLATAQTIATWMKIARQALADVPALQSVIDSRLQYMVRRRLETQVLNGDGSGSNLTGILNTSGIGKVVFNSAELPADQILSGITAVLLADGMADGIVMYPTDWQAVLKAKGSTTGMYYSGGPFQMTPQMIWGVPLVPSQAIPVGKSLVADFEIGALLLIREGVQVLMSDSDQDDFIKNRITILAEMRAALAVWRPPAMVEVDLA